jgi:hypothetical protein
MVATATNALAAELRGGVVSGTQQGLLIFAAGFGTIVAATFAAGWWAASRSIAQRQRLQARSAITGAGAAAAAGATGGDPASSAPVMSIRFVVDDEALTGQELSWLSMRAWGRTKPVDVLDAALRRTINITAREATGQLVGCCRVLSDGMFSTCRCGFCRGCVPCQLTLLVVVAAAVTVH